MSVNEKMTAIADAIRDKTGGTDKLGLDDMSQAIPEVYDAGYTNAEQTATEEKAALSLSLSEALTSGASNEESLETNVEQAKADFEMLKSFIKLVFEVDVPVGTPTSRYDMLLAEGLIRAEDDAWDDGHAVGKSAGYQNAKSEIEEVTVTPTLEAQEILPTEPNLISKVTVKSGQALYDEGKQAQYDEFWDNYQNYGHRGDYVNAFGGGGWSKELFNPKYVIKPYNASRMFDTNAPGGAKDGTLDLRDYADKFDWSICTNVTSLFNYAYIISAVGSVNTSQCALLTNICNYALYLHTFEKLILKNNGTQTFSSAFNKATALKNIAIEGVIGNTLDMRWSPLSKDSIIGKLITPEEYEALSDSVKNYNVFEFNGNYYYGGVITALKSDATGKTLTLKKTAVNTAFGINVDDETTYPAGSEFYELRHSKDNWTFSYV